MIKIKRLFDIQEKYSRVERDNCYSIVSFSEGGDIKKDVHEFNLYFRGYLKAKSSKAKNLFIILSVKNKSKSKIKIINYIRCYKKLDYGVEKVCESTLLDCNIHSLISCRYELFVMSNTDLEITIIISKMGGFEKTSSIAGERINIIEGEGYVIF